jgi:hypothetical protein
MTNMKNFLRKLAPLALGAALWPSAAVAAPPGNDDLVLGFQAASGTGQGKNVLVNLATLTAVRDTPNSIAKINIKSQLDDAFGNTWFTRKDVFFGAVGNRSIAADLSGDVSRTFYYTAQATAPGNGVLRSALSNTQLGIAGSSFAGQKSMMAGFAFADGTQTLTQATQGVAWGNGWTTKNPFLGSTGVEPNIVWSQDAAYTMFGDGIQQRFGRGGSVVYADIQRMAPGSPSTYEATIAITSDGDVVVGSSFTTLTVTTPSNGSIQYVANSAVVTSGALFSTGSTVDLKAVPASNYLFGAWTDASISTTTPLTLTMDVNKTIGATFIASELVDSDGDGMSNFDEENIHLTNPNVANTVPGLPSNMNFEGTLGGLSGAEISAFDPASKRLFTTSGSGLQIIDLTNPATPTLIGTINVSAAPISAVSNDIASVATYGGKVACTVLNSNKEVAGQVVFFDAATASAAGAGFLSKVTIGFNPDHVTFTPNGQTVLVANEGEYLDDNGGPGTTPGSVSIIDVSGGFAAPTVNTVGFGSFDGQETALRTEGVRIFAGQAASNDLEPEYIAVSPDGATAMITLQENNAIAVLNIATATFTDIIPLGTKDFSSLLADFSDQDAPDGPDDGPEGDQISRLKTGNPVSGLYMPDGIASYTQSGQTFYVMANEGDDRNDFLAPNETATVSSLDLDDTTFPTEASLKLAANLGRLTVTKNGANGLPLAIPYTQLLALGGRSFTIRNASGAIVYDSGDLIEKTIATYGKDDGPVTAIAPINAVTDPIADDSRSDNKAAEPEGVAVATIGSSIYAFVTLERANGVMVFDITDSGNVTVFGFLRGLGDLSPEGVIVVPAVDSPNAKSLVVVSNEVSNTVSVFSFDTDTVADVDTNGFTDFQEAQLAALVASPFQVGQDVNLNLGPILYPLPNGRTLSLTGLPPGLRFNATTGVISGRISAESGDILGQLTLRQGTTVVGVVPFNLTVVPFQLLGRFEVLLENAGLPVGKASLTVTGPRAYSATLEMQNQAIRRKSGSLTSVVTSPFVVEFPAGRGGFPAATLVSFVVSSSSDLVSGTAGFAPATTGLATARGFRLAKAGRSLARSVTVALSNNVASVNRTITPGGTGFASGTLSAAGLLTLRGQLGDATTLTTGLNLSQTNQAVVFVQPYTDKVSSFFGGIITIGDLGQPGRGGSLQSQTAGLQWRKANGIALTKSYPLGFGNPTPLAVTGRVSRWVPVLSAEGLALSLGLDLRLIDVSYTVPTVLPPTSAYPSQLALRNTFSLVRVAPSNSVAWTARATSSAGTFLGNLTLPFPAAKSAVSGVFLQDAAFGTQVGVGVIKIPTNTTGSFETAGIRFDN